MVTQSLSDTAGEQFAVKVLFKTQSNTVPANVTVLNYGIRIRLAQTDGNGNHSTLCSSPTSTTTRMIQREQLIDCHIVHARRFFLGQSCGQVRVRYLEFTDNGMKKNNHLHYGYVLQEQIVYLLADAVTQTEQLIERIKLLISSEPVEKTKRDVRFTPCRSSGVSFEATGRSSSWAALKPYLIFVNPCSGAGKALSLFKNTVAPMFDRLRVPYVLFKTEYPGHAEFWIKHSSATTLTKYRGLLTISGDGLIYEVINGLAYRNTALDDDDDDNMNLECDTLVTGNGMSKKQGDVHDSDVTDGVLEWIGQEPSNVHLKSIAKSRISIPLGFLPAGGGNATASAVCYASGLASREKCLLHSAFVLSHNPPSSLVQLQTSDSALSPAQQLCPLDAILFETIEPQTQRIGILSIEWGGLADLDLRSERFRWLGQTRFALAALISMARWSVTNPQNKEFRAKVSYLPAPKSKSNGLEISSNRGTHYTPVDTAFTQNEMTNDELPWASSRYSSGGQKKWARRYLPATNEPVPTSWTTLRDSFWTVLITNHSHIATDAMLHPDARFDNGQLNLVLIYSHVKCVDLIGLPEYLASGDGMRDTSYWKIIPVLAVRVEPEIVSSYTMLDGEPVQSGPFQVEVVPRQFSVITCPVRVPASNSDFTN